MARIVLVFSFLLFSLPVFFTGFSSSNTEQRQQTLAPDQDPELKMGMFLRNALERPDVINGERKVVVMIQLDKNMTAEMTKQLIATGMEIISPMGTRVTAAGYEDAVVNAARLPFVMSMDLTGR